MIKYIFFILSFFTLNCCCQEYSTKWTDLNYADDGMSFHLADIYLPKITKQAYPVVVLIYGSAWYSNNSKGADMNTIGSALLDAGYAVVTPNHRSSSDSIFPAQIHDIKATIRFIRANSNKYQLDTTFIGITGSSSGGHLAALAGTSNNVKQFTMDTLTIDLEGTLGIYTEYSSEVDAVCDWFGPTDFLIMDSCGSSMNHDAPDSPESSLIGGKIQNNQLKCALADPVTYVDPTDPPFLIMHGDADPLVPYCESEALYQALQSATVASEYILVPGGKHSPGVHTSENFDRMVVFFNNVSNNNISTVIDNPFDSSIKFYPNPARNKIIVQGVPDIRFIKYEILDLSGKVLTDHQIENCKIDVTCLIKGSYFIKLQTKEGNTCTKFFIKT